MMYLPHSSNNYTISDSVPYTSGFVPDTLSSWQLTRAADIASRLRLPAVFASQRIGLTSRRCDELQEHIDETSRRLLNVRGSAEGSDVRSMEQRLLELQDKLHKERLDLWKDLLPLAETARDAGVEAARHAWLAEFTRTVGGDHQ